jgi:hypothetical protein
MANSIKISLSGPTSSERLIQRPASLGQTSVTAAFTNLIPGNYTYIATAYPNSDGTGNAQAQGIQNLVVTKDQTTSTVISLTSTVNEVRISPNTPSTTPSGTATITGTAYDVSGAVVVTAEEKWEWVSDNPAVATVKDKVNSTTITGVAEGTTTITGTETESGKGAFITVRVVRDKGSVIVRVN